MTNGKTASKSVFEDLPEIVRAYIASYNGRDLAGMMACLHGDVHFSSFSQGTLDSEAKGKEAFAEMAEAAIVAFSERQQTVTKAIVVSQFTSLEIDYQATVARDLPNGWQAGSVITLSGKSLFQVSAGRIIRLIDES